ncbi:MAG: GH3 auxin-responsive promoter family protein [Chloroflexota bacterium]|nr:GH3 auxin-responsive promoter family protein [Chloroflexota bacterium]
MSTASELWMRGDTQEIWQKCCGFIDLGMEDFMSIQRRLLLEQIQYLNSCELGQAVMRGARPRTVEEFRAQVPLTTYADYAPFLDTKREDTLPQPAVYWQRTSGKSTAFYHKWSPLTERMAEELSSLILAAATFCTCRDKGEFRLRKDENLLYIMAPPPYVTGTYVKWAKKEFTFNIFPSEEEAVNMPFDQRINLGFQQAFDRGVSLLFGISGVLVAVGEKLAKPDEGVKLTSLVTKPKVLLRLAKGMLKAKMAHRPLMPKDLWSVNGILSGGTDTSIYKDRIWEMWGKPPLDIYGSAEASLVAMQTWDYDGMTFIPQLNFFEFIPEEERQREREDPDYNPRTVLLDEVRAGQVYEIVITNFHGGAFTRYRLGDLVKITALRNEKLAIDTPQMAFHSRADGVIEFANFTHALLTEKVLWRAIEQSGVAYEDWVARKEAKGGKPIVHLYIEPKDGTLSTQQATAAVHEQLKALDEGYAELETIGMQPLEVTFLPQAAFKEYIARQQEAGADLGHLKPRHMNPSDEVINALLGTTRPRVRRVKGERVAASSA